MEDQARGRGRGRGRAVRPPTTAMSLISVGRSSGSSGGEHAHSGSTSGSTITASSQSGPLTITTTSSGSSGGAVAPIVETMIEKIEKMTMFSLVKRPDHGTLGAMMKLRCNFFELKIEGGEGKMIIHHYRIEMKHEKRVLRREDFRELFWEVMLKQPKLISEPYEAVFDGGNSFYSLKKIDFPGGSSMFSEDVNVMLTGDLRRNKYSVVIKYIGDACFDMKNDRVIPNGSHFSTITPVQLVDLVLHQYYAVPSRYFPGGVKPFADGGRSYYYIPKSDSDIVPLGGFVESWQGYFASVRFCQNNRTFVNIDTSNGIFLTQQPVLHFLCKVLNTSMKTNKYNPAQITPDLQLKENERRFFKADIKGIRVKVNHLNNDKVFTVRDVSDTGAHEIIFEKRSKDGQSEEKVSVAQYFKDVYGGLKYPCLPCLNVGTKTRAVYLPLEKCEIYGPQKYKKKINEEQTSSLIKAVCTDAMRRAEQIMTVIQKANFPADPFLKHFGIKINPNAAEIEGRRLNAPKITYFEDRMVEPRDGVWSCDRNRFYLPCQFPTYALLSFVQKNKQDQLQYFCEHLSSNATGLGIKNFSLPRKVDYITDERELEARFLAYKQEGILFVIVVMERKSSLIYSEVKRCGDVVHGIMTQCLQFKTVMAPKPMTLGNLLLKINSKLEGINSLVGGVPIVSKYLNENELTLVLGIDVTHPGPTDRRSPSIAAVVGNLDTLPSKWGASIVVQKYRREAVVYMTNAVRERVYAFYETTGKAPRRIVVFRDGVSEGQFNEILGEELTNIRNACQELSSGFKPTVTMIIVQKRHHVRLFCADQRNMTGKARNVPPGTVVDQTVTHATNFDFYLCSHFGIQGTSRPAHYHVLLDENNFTSDEIQALTYQLCHMYCRCTRSVSIPAPVYYAHLAAARAKAHIMVNVGDDNMSTHSGTSGGSVPEDLLMKGCQVADDIKSRMYFV